jgi:hypothetical protein
MKVGNVRRWVGGGCCLPEMLAVDWTERSLGLFGRELPRAFQQCQLYSRPRAESP